MDGGDRAGYKQISKNVDAVIITSTMGAASATIAWGGFEVISSAAAVTIITAPGITNSSLLTTAPTLPKGTFIGGGNITEVKLSANSTGHKIMAYEKVVL